MDKLQYKQRAIGLLMVLGRIFVLVAIWNLPER